MLNINHCHDRGWNVSSLKSMKYEKTMKKSVGKISLIIRFELKQNDLKFLLMATCHNIDQQEEAGNVSCDHKNQFIE